MSGELSHLDDTGRVHMVDVGGKPHERRRATAAATVRMAPETVERLRELPKGDALACAEVAGIMAAKRTSELIPLCHPLPLTHVSVKAEPGDASVEITAVAETTAQTGVEMEALTAAAVAALTLYDMVKGVDSQLVDRGRSAAGEDEVVKAAVLTVSDGVVGGHARGPERRRPRGVACGRGLRRDPARRPGREEEISPAISELAERPRSCSRPAAPGSGRATSRRRPRAPSLDRWAPGIAEAIRADAVTKTPHGLLSRGIAGIRGRTLVVNLPGLARGLPGRLRRASAGARARRAADRR